MPGQIQFVRQGEATADKRALRQKAVLDTGHDWKLRIYLDRKLIFPNIVETSLKPDTVLVSQQSKTLVVIELTFPWEENCEETHERNSLKYTDLIADCKDKGWNVWLFPLEVGCRGFPAQSVWKLLTRLGMSGRTHKTTTRILGEADQRTICAGSRDPSRSGLAITVDPPTGGCHGLGSKHPVKVGHHLKTIITDGRAPRGEKYSIRYVRECQAYIKQNSIICKCTLSSLYG